MSTVRIDTTSVSYGEAQCTLVKVSGNDASHLDGPSIVSGMALVEMKR